jgi:hypothetical protein
MAPFSGGGVPDDAPAQAFRTQFWGMGPGQGQTGMVYTPPEFSDHIGVALLLRVLPHPECDQDTEGARARLAVTRVARRQLQLTRDDATKAAQPHMQQPCITSFWGSSCSGTNTGTGLAPLGKAIKRPSLAGGEPTEIAEKKKGKMTLFFSAANGQ